MLLYCWKGQWENSKKKSVWRNAKKNRIARTSVLWVFCLPQGLVHRFTHLFQKTCVCFQLIKLKLPTLKLKLISHSDEDFFINTPTVSTCDNFIRSVVDETYLNVYCKNSFEQKNLCCAILQILGKF